MSWAAYRETHRVEDRAYCLLGLFDVSLDLRYGELEGWRAFQRLQERILKTSTDQSIFAWTQHGPLSPLEKLDPRRRGDPSLPDTCSILAPTPDCFHGSSSIIVPANIDPSRSHPRQAQHLSGFNGKELHKLNMPIALSSTGLEVSLLIKSITKLGVGHMVEAMLNCSYERDDSRMITILLVADMHGHIKDRKHGIVPAWRVEPYYLGTADSMEDGSTVTRFDLYPIHANWPAVPDGFQNINATLEEHEVQRRAARRRVRQAKETATRSKNECKTTSAAITFTALSAMVVMCCLDKSSRKEYR